MKAKNVVSSVLFLFVAASVVYLVAGESFSRNAREPTGAPDETTEPLPSAAATGNGAGARPEPVETTEHPVEVTEMPGTVVAEEAEAGEAPAEVTLESVTVLEDVKEAVKAPTEITEEPVAIVEEKAEVEVEPARVVKAPTAPKYKLVAYYFHRTQRCRTCLAMEAYAEDALRQGFADAFASGELEWHAVNVEESKHEHFVEEYELTASALVMVLLENGKRKEWKDLGRVWELVGDEQEFKGYVRDEATAYVGNGS